MLPRLRRVADCFRSMEQEFTDEAEGENVLIVSHMDAVNASVTRYKPWALVYPVQHTGFTASYREKYDGALRLATSPRPTLRVMSCPRLCSRPTPCRQILT